MSEVRRIGARSVGEGCPVYIIAEIGINHNGDLQIAQQLIDAAVRAGCDAVKFQKRTPEICVTPQQRDVQRDTPWGRITYLEYRHRVEFGQPEYTQIDAYCRQRGIDWFASCWDKPSVDFIEQFHPVCYKIASASLTDDDLLRYTSATGRPIIVSTGMSTMAEIRHAVSLFDLSRTLLLHSTSSYPCPPGELNLRMIETLRREFPCPIGYSGHEAGLTPTYAAVSLGARLVERHITLDRASAEQTGQLSQDEPAPAGYASLVLCQSAIMGFDVKVPGGKKVADRSAILALGSRSEPRRSGEATPVPKVDKALVCLTRDFDMWTALDEQMHHGSHRQADLFLAGGGHRLHRTSVLAGGLDVRGCSSKPC